MAKVKKWISFVNRKPHHPPQHPFGFRTAAFSRAGISLIPPSGLTGGVRAVLLLQASIFQDTVQCAFGNVLAVNWNHYDFCSRLFVDGVAAGLPHENITILLKQANQLTRLHGLALVT